MCICFPDTCLAGVEGNGIVSDRVTSSEQILELATCPACPGSLSSVRQNHLPLSACTSFLKATTFCFSAVPVTQQFPGQPNKRMYLALKVRDYCCCPLRWANHGWCWRESQKQVPCSSFSPQKCGSALWLFSDVIIDLFLLYLEWFDLSFKLEVSQRKGFEVQSDPNFKK